MFDCFLDFCNNPIAILPYLNLFLISSSSRDNSNIDDGIKLLLLKSVSVLYNK